MNDPITSPQLKAYSPQQIIPPPSPGLKFTPAEDLINNFNERRNFIIKKMAEISQQTEDPEKRITELRGLIFAKPSMQEAISVQDVLKKYNSAFNRQVLQELTKDIDLSVSCIQTLRTFYEFQKSLSQPERISQIKHIVESTWKQIYRLPIHDPLLFNEVSTVEWNLKAMQVLTHNRADSYYPYVESCEILKKGALESHNRGILESHLYKLIEGELKRHRYLTEKVRIILDLDSVDKIDVEEAQSLLQDLNEFAFGMKEEIESVGEILNRAAKIEQRFQEFILNRFLASPNDFKELTLQLQNFPLKFFRIEEYLSKLRTEQKEQVNVLLEETVQRISEENRELYLKFYRHTKKISKDNLTGVPTEDLWKVSEEEMQKIIQYSAELIERMKTFKFEDFCMITKQSTSKGYEHIRAELWLSKIKLLRIFCEGIVRLLKPITFMELRSFLPEIKEYIDSLPEPKRAPFDEQMSFLRQMLLKIRTWVKEEEDKGEIFVEKIFYGFIFVNKEMTKPAEKQTKILSLQVLVKKLRANARVFESLNKKRNRVDENEDIQEVNSFENIEKRMKKQNEIYQFLTQQVG